MTLHHPEATPEQLARGLAAAVDVFQRAGVDPRSALEAIDKEDAWDGSGFDDQYALTPADLHVLEVLANAQVAANKALGSLPGNPAQIEFEF
ncbi:hypothetical protein [Variovorax sp. GT1P44]|uniref:hypothetical protein n=1 Tax=Variovorax sp. GT1P44 TaxID=3443742 RepID=UPI003F466E84